MLKQISIAPHTEFGIQRPDVDFSPAQPAFQESDAPETLKVCASADPITSQLYALITMDDNRRYRACILGELGRLETRVKTVMVHTPPFLSIRKEVIVVARG